VSCHHYQEAIHELVDGTIGAIRRAELQTHLDRCEMCRSLVADLQRICRVAETLDRPAPPDHVWMHIAGRLRQEGRVLLAAPAVRSARTQYAWLALAAALVIAVAGSLFVLLPRFRAGQADTRGVALESRPGNAGADDTVQSVESEFRLAEQHLQNGIAKLEEAARSGAGTIDPQTAEVLRRNLTVIDQAIDESRAALQAEPQSAAARETLFDALRRKVALLQDTIALMNEMRKGNSVGAAQIVGGANKS
jgi:hypothetical protein